MLFQWRGAAWRDTKSRSCAPPAPPALQYAPWLGMLALKKVGPARARALRAGKSGYDLSALMQDKGTEA